MRNMLIRTFFTLILPLLAMGSAHGTEKYPSQSIQMIVGYAAGGPTDVTARVLAQELTKSLGESVVVSNKTGGASLIATKDVLRAKPDGYTLLFASLGHNVNPILLPEAANYDPINDFAPISLVATQPLIAVTAHGSEFSSLKDLLEHARSHPGEVSFGSAGNGGSAHLAAELLALSANVDMLHVPFRGNAPALTEVIAGRVSFMFYPSVGISEQVEAKRLKVLAVGPSSGLSQFPNVPTMASFGYKGFDEAAPWVGLLAPKGTPPEIVARLNEAMTAALAQPEVRRRLEELGNVIAGGSPDDFSNYLRESTRTMTDVIQRAGIKGN